MALNEPSELEDQLRDTGDEYTDVDLSKRLRQANNRLDTLVGRRFVEPKEIRFEDQTSVDLDFGRLESFDKAVNFSEGEEIIEASNYSVDLDTGTVNFNQSFVDDNFFEGLVLKFYYVPEAFKDLELYVAQRNIQELQTIQTTDDVNNTQTDRLNTRIQRLISNINSRNSTGMQRGDNENRGSARPRRFNHG